MNSSTALIVAFVLWFIRYVRSDCSLGLGMITGDIRDSQITASSSYSEWTQPFAGRLWNTRRPHGQTFGGWCATDWDRTPYLQIDFGQESVITAVATQGLDYPSGNWVKKYSLNYSCDGMNWETYQNMDKDTRLRGNKDDSSVVTNKLDKAIIARFIRILVREWNEYGIVCMRVEMYGCNTEEGGYKDCSAAAGMERGQISDKQVTASSFIQGHHPHQGRLNNVFKQVNGSALWGSWCAQNVDTTQYIQVDLKELRNISGVATQGSVSMGTWVTEYTLNYSSDGLQWQTYSNETGTAMTLRGNWDEVTVHKNMFKRRISARYLRFNPRAWTPLGQICMRVEIYLCQIYQGCSKPTERSPTETSTTFSDKTFPSTRKLTPSATLKSSTKRTNPTVASESVARKLYSRGFRRKTTDTICLMAAWLLLMVNLLVDN